MPKRLGWNDCPYPPINASAQPLHHAENLGEA
jgi:hypothetical protein